MGCIHLLALKKNKHNCKRKNTKTVIHQIIVLLITNFIPGIRCSNWLRVTFIIELFDRQNTNNQLKTKFKFFSKT
jgi:hypothetical protein